MSKQHHDTVVKAAGGALAVLVALPLYRILAGSGGIAAAQFVEASSGHARSGLVSLLLIAAGAGLLGWLRPAWWGRIAAAVDRLPDGVLPGLAAAVAFVASVTFSALALGGGPYLVDGMSQLLQARLFSGGTLTLSDELPAAFVHYQYLASTPEGWASQYPPGFAALLALGMRLGAPWVVGPAAHAAMTWVGVRLTQTLVADDRPLVLVSSALLALSPFYVALAGAYMNHGLAALLAAVAVLQALRASTGGRPWVAGVIAGGAVGLLAAVRPLAAVIAASVAGLAWLWGPRDVERSRGRASFPLAAAGAAAIPTLLLLAYNRRLFGGALSFGYEVAQGPEHGLGFHVDPWGAFYGPLQALAYTASELRALGAELLGLPVPLTLILGLVLVWKGTARRLLMLPLAWVCLTLAAGFFYWHHDLSMGPRLLADAAPAWAVLVAWALVTGAREGSKLKSGALRPYLGGASAALLVAAAVASPVRLSTYGRVARASDLFVVARAPEASLVFVHGSWDARLAARLAQLGLRDDQARAVLRSWSTCELQQALNGPATSTNALLARLVDGSTAPLTMRTMPSGSTLRTYEGERLTPECEREAQSDFQGIAGLPQRSWRGDLPGAERGRAMYVRDLGPEANATALEVYPDRTPYLLVPEAPASPARLWPYEEGMARLWGPPG